MKQAKTNAMRMLARQKIHYELREFPSDGQKAADYLGLPPAMIFKTLPVNILCSAFPPVRSWTSKKLPRLLESSESKC